MDFKRTKNVNQLIERKHNGMIKVVSGLRRCGKTYLLFKLFAEHLLESGVAEDHIIKIALDDIKYSELRDALKLYNFIVSKIKDSEKYYILLDEIQFVPDFVGLLNGLLHIENADTYVTGSNSRFLSSDIVTEFRGRGDEVRLRPLTFAEYSEGISGESHELLNNYLIFGGMPGCAVIREEERKIQYLTMLYQTIYLRDIIERVKIRNTEEFRELTEMLASDIGGLTNPKKLSDTFLSVKGIKITHDTVVSYINSLVDSFLVERAQRYDIKGKKYISTPLKYYFGDLGIRNAALGFRQSEKNHLMENLIYNELRYRGFSVDVGVVAKSIKNKNGNGTTVNYEVDFVANKGFKRFYIQSAYILDDEEKRLQEERSLDNINDNFAKVVISMYGTVRYYQNDKGYMILSLEEFLKNEDLIN